jgi:hypothetical protein
MSASGHQESKVNYCNPLSAKLCLENIRFTETSIIKHEEEQEIVSRHKKDSIVLELLHIML